MFYNRCAEIRNRGINKEKKMFSFLSINVILGIIIGGVVGYGFYKLVGCSSGACPLTSNPWVSTIYGALLGFLITKF